jgi:hypothetical protein
MFENAIIEQVDDREDYGDTLSQYLASPLSRPALSIFSRVKYSNDVDRFGCDFVYDDEWKAADDQLARSVKGATTPNTRKLRETFDTRPYANDGAGGSWLIMTRDKSVNPVHVGESRPAVPKLHPARSR